MKKFGWYAVSAAVVAVIIGGGLLLAANLYVQSHTVQHRIHEALAASLKMPVTLKKTTITPWGGLRLDGIVLRPEDGKSADVPSGVAAEPVADFLTAASFRVRFAWWPLISQQRVVIEEVLLDRPSLDWPQDPDGRWQFPPGNEPRHAKPSHQPKPGEPAASPVIAAESPGAVPPASPAAVAAETPTAGAPLIASTKPKAAPTEKKNALAEIAIDKVRIRHGEMEFLNEKRHSIAKLDEINVDGKIEGIHRATGSVRIESASAPRTGLQLTHFQSAFIYDESDGLQLNDGHADIGGGKLRGAYRVRTNEPGAPFTADCHLENVAIEQLIPTSGKNSQFIEGRLQGDFVMSGPSDHAEGRTASGQFRLEGAQLKNSPFFQMMGQALQIADLSRLQFKKAQMDYRIDGAVMQIDSIALISNDLQMVAHGRYLMNEDRLDLHATLTIDQAIGRQLPQFMEENFTPCGNDAPGSKFIDFAVTGPLEKPNTADLYKRVMAGPMDGLLQSFVTQKPKASRNRNGQKKDPKPVPGASATPTP